jgi:hypothetical protein
LNCDDCGDGNGCGDGDYGDHCDDYDGVDGVNVDSDDWDGYGDCEGSDDAIAADSDYFLFIFIYLLIYL